MTTLERDTPSFPAAGFDALPPPAMAARAEEIGTTKAALASSKLFVLAILAGAFIAMGAVFATTTTAGSAELAFGVTRLLAGLTFSLGLILVVVAGAADHGPNLPPAVDLERPHQDQVADLDDLAARGLREGGPDQLDIGRAREDGVRLDAVLGQLPVRARLEHRGEHDVPGRVEHAAVQERVVAGLVAGAALQLAEDQRRRRVGLLGHAELAPGGPVDRHDEAVAARPGVGEGVEEVVGGAVVDQAVVARDGHDRREQDQEVDAIAE